MKTCAAVFAGFGALVSAQAIAQDSGRLGPALETGQ